MTRISAGQSAGTLCGATPAAIVQDLPCAECGYNLRTLPTDSACPECGRRIADTLAAGPVTAWLPGVRRGLTCLAVAWVALPLAEIGIWSDSFRIGPRAVNRDGVTYLVEALLAAPAAWYLTRPAPFLRRDPGRLRRREMSLLAAVAGGGILASLLLHHVGYGYSLVLLSIYGLVPPAFAVALWLLFRTVVDATEVLPSPPRRRLLAGLHVVLLYSLLGPTLHMALVSAARIRQLNEPFAPRSSYIPEFWNTLLSNVLSWPASVVRPPLWLVCLGVILYSRFALRRGVLPGKTGLSGRSAMQ